MFIKVATANTVVAPIKARKLTREFSLLKRPTEAGYSIESLSSVLRTDGAKGMLTLR